MGVNTYDVVEVSSPPEPAYAQPQPQAYDQPGYAQPPQNAHYGAAPVHTHVHCTENKGTSEGVMVQLVVLIVGLFFFPVWAVGFAYKDNPDETTRMLARINCLLFLLALLLMAISCVCFCFILIIYIIFVVLIIGVAAAGAYY